MKSVVASCVEFTLLPVAPTWLKKNIIAGLNIKNLVKSGNCLVIFFFSEINIKLPLKNEIEKY